MNAKHKQTEHRVVVTQAHSVTLAILVAKANPAKADAAALEVRLQCADRAMSMDANTPTFRSCEATRKASKQKQAPT